MFGFEGRPVLTVDQALTRVHEDDLPAVRAAMARAFDPEVGGQYDIENRLIVPGRAERWVRSVGRCTFRDDASAPGGRVADRFFGVVMDVTERHRDQARMSESERRLRELFTSIDEGYCLCEMLLDDDGRPVDYRFLEANPLFEKFTGINDPVGRTAYTAIPELERHWVETYARVALQRETLRFEQWAEPLGMWFDVFATPSGGERQFAIVFKDVTQRKLAEEQLRRSEHQLRTLTQNIPDIIGRFDRDLRHVFVSGASLTTATGLTPEQVIGKSNRELGFPEDFLDTWEPALRRTFETGQEQPHETAFMTPTGERFFETRMVPEFGADKTVEAVVVVVRDVTERRAQQEALAQREREMRTLAANTPDVIARFDLQLRHVFINEAVTKATGLKPEAWIGKTSHEMGTMSTQLCDEWNARLRAAIETGEPRTYDFSHESPTGERFYESRIVPEFDASGRVETVLGVTRDVTHARRMEQQMRATMEEAERANAAKDHFLAVLSHELRTPLTPVLVAAGELSRRADLPDDVREDLKMVRRNVELESRLMDDLLDLTRVARGKLELELRPIDVHDKMRHVARMVEAESEGKQVRVSLDLAAEHFTVPADAARLQQVLWNLLKNGIKFTPSGGVVVVRTSNEQDRLAIEVSDTGIGIEADLLPKVFDAFEQGGAAVTRQFGGLGLGLAITKILVDLHGGTIRAQSPGRDRGATFRVELPTTTPSRPTTSTATAPATTRKLRVLLVEDHDDTGKMMARLLRSRRMSVKVSDTVSAGLRAAEAETFDVIVSDLGLPDGSGHDLLRQIRAGGIDTPAVVLSGFGSDRDRAHSAAAGFAEHLTKPIDLDLLVQTIRRVATPTPARAT